MSRSSKPNPLQLKRFDAVNKLKAIDAGILTNVRDFITIVNCDKAIIIKEYHTLHKYFEEGGVDNIPKILKECKEYVDLIEEWNVISNYFKFAIHYTSYSCDEDAWLLPLDPDKCEMSVDGVDDNTVTIRVGSIRIIFDIRVASGDLDYVDGYSKMVSRLEKAASQI